MGDWGVLAMAPRCIKVIFRTLCSYSAYYVPIFCRLCSRILQIMLPYFAHYALIFRILCSIFMSIMLIFRPILLCSNNFHIRLPYFSHYGPIFRTLCPYILLIMPDIYAYYVICRTLRVKSRKDISIPERTRPPMNRKRRFARLIRMLWRSWLLKTNPYSRTSSWDRLCSTKQTTSWNMVRNPNPNPNLTLTWP